VKHSRLELLRQRSYSRPPAGLFRLSAFRLAFFWPGILIEARLLRDSASLDAGRWSHRFLPVAIVMAGGYAGHSRYGKYSFLDRGSSHAFPARSATIARSFRDCNARTRSRESQLMSVAAAFCHIAPQESATDHSDF